MTSTADLEIRKGDKFLCTRTLHMDNGSVAFLAGKTYNSGHDDSLHSEVSEDHLITDDWKDAFGPCDSGKDYFDSMREEYGGDKVNFVQDVNTPIPEYGYTITTTASGIYTPPTETEQLIAQECEDLKNLLISKNRRYGDSALTKGSTFGLSPVVAIKARIEDKWNRLKNLQDGESEDVILDLLGYFILLRIAQKKEQ